jgi:hypothetical protein
MLIRHSLFPQLIGKLEDKSGSLYGVTWKEPWLAATLLEGQDLFHIDEDSYEVLEEQEELRFLIDSKSLKNVPCSFCNGTGTRKVHDRRKILLNGPYEVCPTCKGTKVVRSEDL